MLTRAFASLALAAAAASSALADLNYTYTSFESLGYAWTDAGDEYAYTINTADELIGVGNYSFEEYGGAPGYSSSAAIGVTHDSSLTSTGFHLTGQARSYVSDDVGYAACSAWSESTVFITFTLTERSRITLTGHLGLSSFGGAPSSLSNQIQLRNSANQLLASFSGVTQIDQSIILPAGNYTFYASTSVADEIDFSGGDVYDTNLSTFDITLAATPSPLSTRRHRTMYAPVLER